MPDVFTIYCHGTGNRRQKNQDEIIDYFSTNHKGDEFEDYLILDGVGAKGSPGFPMPGEFEFDPESPSFRRPLQGRRTAVKKNPKVAQAAGHGLSSNIEFAIQFLLHLLKNSPSFPRVINMLGFSRGAVTCLMLANRILSDITQSVEINICAIDPVAGGKAGNDRSKVDNRTIPPEVKNYLAILATGENRKSFAPQDARSIGQRVNLQASNVMFLPMPGIHKHLSKFGTGKTAVISQIVWSIAYDFLKKFGSKSIKPKKYVDSDAGYLKLYTKLLAQDSEYAALAHRTVGARIVGKGLASRDVLKNLDLYVVNPEYFINQHHRKCFAACHRDIFKYYFSKKGGDANQRNLVSQAVLDLDDPRLIQTLFLLGFQRRQAGGSEEAVLPVQGEGVNPARAKRLLFNGSLLAMGILKSKLVEV